jgi:TRAP transporter TAXI family solute receptor
MNRRELLAIALAAGLAGCATGEYDGPTKNVRIAAGESGGFYVEFASLLARRLDPELNGRVLVTGGSRTNLELVSGGDAELGLALADIAESAANGVSPFTAPMELRAIGRVYENYMQLVVAADSPLRTVRDLVGARVALGAYGSGAAPFGDRLLAASGVAMQVDHRSLKQTTAALADGTLDALLWSGGVPTPKIEELARLRPIRLLDLTGALPALHTAHGPVYRRVVVPAGTYGMPQAVATIGVSNLLVCAAGLAGDVAAAVTRVLVRQAPRLVPPSALGTQYLDLRSLVTTEPIPLHPGAATAYRDLRG